MKQTRCLGESMMSDEEFLVGVREKIQTMECAIREEERMRNVRFTMFRSRCKFILLLVLVTFLFWWMGSKYMGTQGTLYLWAFAMLGLGSLYEYVQEVRSEIRWRS